MSYFLYIFFLNSSEGSEVDTALKMVLCDLLFLKETRQSNFFPSLLFHTEYLTEKSRSVNNTKRRNTVNSWSKIIRQKRPCIFMPVSSPLSPSFEIKIIWTTHLRICGKSNWHVCLQASTQFLRSFRIFSRISGQSFDVPMCIRRSRNKATWLLISEINWK